MLNDVLAITCDDCELPSHTSLSNITLTQLNVPEPTTATLSLLALAGLAARRRR